MSSIGNTTTRIIDPSFDRSNFRAEFRLPADSVFASNLRLLNVGISSDAGNESYSPTLGAMGAIRSIHIYDGSELLDSIENFPVYASWKNINKTNDANISQNRHLNYVGIGYVMNGRQSATAGALNLDDNLITEQNPVTDAITNNKSAWISLQSCFSFLKNSMIIPTTLYRQLRVVVTYQDAEGLKNAVRDVRNTPSLSTDTGTILVCEEVAQGEVMNEMIRQYQGVTYTPWEFDSVRMPAVATANTNDSTKVVPSDNNFLLHGFNNKYLKRLLVVNQPLDSSTWIDGGGAINKGFANHGSQALFREELQVRVNGVNKIAGDGVTGKNRRLAMLTDTFGDCNVINGQQFTQTEDFNNYVGGANQLQSTQGAVDFGGMIIEDNINTLQIFSNRSGVFGNDALNQQINVICMGEVAKAVVVTGQGKGYRVIYTQ